MYHKWTQREDDLIKEAYSQYPIIFSPELLNSPGEIACRVRAKMLRVRQYRFHAIICKQDIANTDLSYIAAFLDGEGSIYLNEKGNKYFLSFSNSDLEVLEWMHTLLHCGKIETRKPNVRYTKKHYIFRIARIADVIYLLKELLPYLHIKNNRASEAIDFNSKVLNKRKQYKEC